CRPGRPPKRAAPMMGVLSTSTSLLKKGRLDGEYHGYKDGHLNGDRLGKVSFLHNGYNQMVAQAAAAAAAAAAATGTSSHISPLPFMALNHQVSHHSMISTSAPSHTQTDRIDGTGVGERSGKISDDYVTNRIRDDPPQSGELRERLYGQESYKSTNTITQSGKIVNGHSPVLNLSQHSSRAVVYSATGNGGKNESDDAYNDRMDDDDSEDEGDDQDHDFSDTPDVSSTANTDHLSAQNALFFSSLTGSSGATVGQAMSSIETLLRNIQGLLKVAADNARQQERQINIEKAELKMEVMRERELRENLEKQILEEQKTKVLYQKRLRKERRSRRRVQEQLEAEVKKRSNCEGNFHTNPAEALRILNESLPQDLDRDHMGRLEEECKDQDLPLSLVASTTTPDSSPSIR
ncbi:dachshund homolog 1-like, partial [Limulus polyphemus]|uniref:Dachshund homolog 1-like n=1 Tax=Limulus polyphemus TaxID=6850 RepID=A0ABM1SH32_LIMPO